MGQEDDDEPREFASAPCSLADIDPAYAGLDGLPGGIATWRKAERERLIAARMAVDAATRGFWDDRIADAVEAAIGDPAGLIVSAYWPFRGEPDLRPLLRRLAERGAAPALPVVVGKGRPLEFRRWQPGDRLERGVWNIPIPADGAPAVPDVVIAPAVGFDPQGYRLGYGGGFFDRTLAALEPHRPHVIGVGYAMQAIPTIHPQPYDIAMDIVVTEDGAG